MDKRGFTQADLQPVLGVGTQGAVSHYLTGKRPLSLEQGADLARFLTTSLDYLLWGDHSADRFNRSRSMIANEIEIALGGKVDFEEIEQHHGSLARSLIEQLYGQKRDIAPADIPEVSLVIGGTATGKLLDLMNQRDRQ